VRGSAAEDESDDAEFHVLVNPREMLDLNSNAGLLQDLAANTLLERFAEFEHSAWWLPVAVVAELDDEDVAVVVDDDPGDADGVLRRC
jgi:hypothetical protein